MEFVYAPELKRLYVCSGHFYRLRLDDGTLQPCRSVLEIYARGVDPLNSLPDAVAVMMNPGRSRPLNAVTASGEPVDQIIAVADIGSLVVSLVETAPDTTQYQIMRLMSEMGWRHVRVVNLSDIREPKSEVFCRRYREIELQPLGEVHSVFALVRASELANKLKRKPGAPILVAFGKEKDLIPLAQRCVGRLPKEGWIGSSVVVRQLGIDHKMYHHASPQMKDAKVEWLELMLEQLGEDPQSAPV